MKIMKILKMTRIGKMNNKKENLKIIVFILLLVFIIECLIHIPIKTETIQNEATDIKIYESKIPDFKLKLSGVYDQIITEKEVIDNEVPIYEFDAIINNGWDNKKNHYVGIKLFDLLEKFKLNKYERIMFNREELKTVNLSLDEITNQMYIVFYRDGKTIQENAPLNLLTIDRDYRYSLENLTELYFIEEINFLPEIEIDDDDGMIIIDKDGNEKRVKGTGDNNDEKK